MTSDGDDVEAKKTALLGVVKDTTRTVPIRLSGRCQEKLTSSPLWAMTVGLRLGEYWDETEESKGRDFDATKPFSLA